MSDLVSVKSVPFVHEHKTILGFDVYRRESQHQHKGREAEAFDVDITLDNERTRRCVVVLFAEDGASHQLMLVPKGSRFEYPANEVHLKNLYTSMGTVAPGFVEALSRYPESAELTEIEPSPVPAQPSSLHDAAMRQIEDLRLALTIAQSEIAELSERITKVEER